MISIPKTVGVMSCSCMLCFGLSHDALADNSAAVNDEMKVDQSDRRQGGQEAGEKQLNEPMKGRDTKGARQLKARWCTSKAISILSEGKMGRKCGCTPTKPPKWQKISSPVIGLKQR